MSGYLELQQAYENNHAVTVLRRNSMREAVNGLRLALLARLGIRDQHSDVVIVKAPDGRDLFAQLAALEIGDVLHSRIEISIEGFSSAPPTKFIFALAISYREDRIVLDVKDIGSKAINNNDDLDIYANLIFERLLLRLSTY